MLIFTAQDAAIKFLSPDYALHQIIFTRSVVAIVLTVLVARLTLGIGAIHERDVQAGTRFARACWSL